MKLDLYTKSILTVIAASLLWLALTNIVSPKPALAQGPVRVIISGMDAEANSFGAIPIPVRLVGGVKYKTLENDEANPIAVMVVDKSK